MNPVTLDALLVALPMASPCVFRIFHYGPFRIGLLRRLCYRFGGGGGTF